MKNNNILRNLSICIFLIGVCIIGVFAADSNGIWHDAKDIRPGIFGGDEVNDFSVPPFFQFQYLFVGFLYDRDNTSYYLNPSSTTNLKNLTIESGNVINNCQVLSDVDYNNLQCGTDFDAVNMVYETAQWHLTCCKYD